MFAGVMVCLLTARAKVAPNTPFPPLPFFFTSLLTSHMFIHNNLRPYILWQSCTFGTILRGLELMIGDRSHVIGKYLKHYSVGFSPKEGQRAQRKGVAIGAEGMAGCSVVRPYMLWQSCTFGTILRAHARLRDWCAV